MIGWGEHRFELQEGWPSSDAPPVRYGWTHGVTVDRDDNVYIHHRGESPVCVFDRNGALIARWGERFREGAHGLSIATEADGTEVLWFADPEAHCVVKTTTSGDELLQIDAPDVSELYYPAHCPPGVWPPPGVFAPTDVAVAADGRVYVADGYGAFVIHSFSAEGEHLGWWRGSGKPGGDLDQPHGLTVIDDEVFVADRANERIQVFDLGGNYLREIVQGVGFICDVVAHDGELWLPDLHSRVTVLLGNGGAVHLGADQSIWERPGWPYIDLPSVREDSFSAPHAIAFDSQGSLYVAEWVETGRVRKFVRIS